MSANTTKWLLVNHLDHGDSGTLSIIDSEFNVNCNMTSELASGSKPAIWFLGVDENFKVILFDPVSKTISLSEQMPKDAFPIYSYNDPTSNRVWFVYDGDDEKGNDALNCGENGSTVTVIERKVGSLPKHLATICVGRGHHVPTFVQPDKILPDQSKLAFVSNLLDGTIHVINNDESSAQFLSILHTIDLTESENEKDGINCAPNNAFPHGKQYSPVTGKIYSLNNGYGTVAVINPETFEIENRIELKGASNLLLSPCGQFVIGKGADRKSDANHVLGKLSVIDVEKQQVVNDYFIPDFYPSVYRFTPDGSKLFVTSAATGKGTQKENLKFNTLYVYDAAHLPELALIKIIEVGAADCSRRPIAFPANPEIKLAFIPNPSDGTVSVIDTSELTVTKTLKIADKGGREFNFSLWESSIYGA